MRYTLTTMKKEPNKTHFGYQEVPLAKKAGKVAEVFHSVASKYDLMNDVMSLGMHRLWKQFTIGKSHVRPGDLVLDVAGGTGDLSKRLAKRVGPTGKVILSDINASMLQAGRDRLLDEGLANNIEFIQADAQHLPFANNTFHCLTIGFGLRNVTDKQCALHDMFRVLKPGGRLLILEFSKPTSPLIQKAYDKYSFKLIPKIGQWVTKDRDSYQYLVESIRMHPDQKNLKDMMEQAKFERCDYHNICGGVVALHIGYKL
jgi:demethylmenaquinone methyltransferase / 2-methoxy-6-polyprenyl-1,4-benzoquinol methylase